MKKHGVIMVLLLILTLCLMGVVSASENVTAVEFENSHMENIQNDRIDDCGTSDMLEDTSIGSESGSGFISNENPEEYISDDEDDLNSGSEFKSFRLENLNVDDSSSDVLIITTSDSCKINDETINVVLNGILNTSNSYVADEDISSLKTDLNIAFFIKNDESFKMLFYRNGDLILLYSGESGLNLTVDLWNNMEKIFGYDDAYKYLGIACSWVNGVSNDMGSILTGIISENNEIQTLSKDYPPKNKFNLPLDDTDEVLGVSRDSGDDAFIWTNELGSGEKAHLIVDMVSESITGFLNLNLKSAETQAKESNGLSIKQIGIDAANDALAYFKSQGIDIQKGYPYLYVLTSAGYVNLNGLSTDSVIEGLSQVLGLELNRNIFPIHNPSWKDLVFYFLWINNTSNDFLSYGLKFDADSNKLFESKEVDGEGEKLAYDMGLLDKPIGKFSTKNVDGFHFKSHYSVSKILKLSGEVITSVSQLLSLKEKNTVESTVNSSNTSDELSNTSISNEKIVHKNANPFNILYTVGAMLIVIVFFGVSYSKRE